MIKILSPSNSCSKVGLKSSGLTACKKGFEGAAAVFLSFPLLLIPNNS